MMGPKSYTASKFPFPDARGGFFAAGMVACLVLGAIPAQASHVASHTTAQTDAKLKKTSGTTVAVKDPDTTGSVQVHDEKSNCNRSRKKLWVEDEGWIVRQVTTCY
ncbi:hypothetical protein [Microvirga rosea]|uniref:hypothetical protein n=1 Tax=Microvirga rosea TaxID=2715425 RepID=UPI001D0B2088|nr:hypothetical protein [Microvirga rosea]MCB8822703.1 hypothetical protein [Microvirga rosea]